MFPEYKIRRWPRRDCNFHFESDNKQWTTGASYVKLSTQIQHKLICTSCIKYCLHKNNYMNITTVWNFEVITNTFKMHGIPLLWLWRYLRTTDLCNRKSRRSAQNLPVYNCFHCHLMNFVPQLQLFITVEWWWWKDTKYKDTGKKVAFLSQYWFWLILKWSSYMSAVTASKLKVQTLSLSNLLVHFCIFSKGIKYSASRITSYLNLAVTCVLLKVCYMVQVLSKHSVNLKQNYNRLRTQMLRYANHKSTCKSVITFIFLPLLI